jgi:hypothetical protein
MQEPIRNRIKGHRRVRSGDLIPHELNFRSHPDLQRAALEGLYHEIGFARSLLAYEMPDGRLKLLDGHLRRDIDPNMEVDVEVLDVNDDEARTLLLSIDPLASLAETENQIRDRLLELTPAPTADIEAAWAAAAEESLNKLAQRESRAVEMGPEQWLVLVRCQDEKHQVQVLERLWGEGLECKALVG